MTTINTNNSMSTSTTYSASSSSKSEISTLQKEKQSLQKEVQQLQSELASSNTDSESIQVEIDTVQSQISTIDSQIASLQSKASENTSSNSQVSAVSKPNQSENPTALKNSLSKLDETTKILENEIALEKSKGFNTENKNEILGNMKENMQNISSKLGQLDKDDKNTNKFNHQTNLVGNLIDSRV